MFALTPFNGWNRRKHMNPASTGHKEPISRTALALAGGIVAVLLALCFAYWVFFHVPKQAAKEMMGKETAEFFNALFGFTPEVKISSTVFIHETKPISDLSTAKKPVVITHKIEDTWLHSKKTLEVRAEFTTTAGFSFTKQGCVVDIQENPLRIVAKFPKPTIQSVTMKSFEILRDEDGWFNNLKKEEREQAIAGLTPLAIRRARDTSSILEDAKASVEKQLLAKAQQKNWQMEVKFE